MKAYVSFKHGSNLFLLHHKFYLQQHISGDQRCTLLSTVKENKENTCKFLLWNNYRYFNSDDKFQSPNANDPAMNEELVQSFKDALCDAYFVQHLVSLY